MANINKQRDAGRARHTKAILAKAMQKRDFSPCANNKVDSVQYIIQICDKNQTIFAHYVGCTNTETIVCKSENKYVQYTI